MKNTDRIGTQIPLTLRSKLALSVPKSDRALGMVQTNNWFGLTKL